MAVFNGAFPILTGKTDAARAFASAVAGSRNAEFQEMQKRAGTTRANRLARPAKDQAAETHRMKGPPGQCLGRPHAPLPRAETALVTYDLYQLPLIRTHVPTRAFRWT